MHDEPSNDPLPDNAPSRRWNRRPFILILLGIGIAGILLAVMFKIDRSGESGEEQVRRLVDLEQISKPSKPSAEEIAEANSEIDGQTVASLEKGAWVQVADERGRLAQEYSADRIDPLPEQWIKMAEPRAKMYPRSGRLISMNAQRGTAHVPSRALESGVLEGDVVIRIFEPRADGSTPTPATEQPSVVINAEVAEFDNVRGEIRSERAVRVSTEELVFQGIGLSILMSEDGRQIDRLIVDRATAPIEIRQQSTEKVAATPATTPAAAPAATPRPIPASTSKPKRKPAVSGRSSVARSAPVSPEAEDEPRIWYRLVLSDDLVVERVTEQGRSVVRGDRLVATFVLGEGGVEGAFASAGRGVGDVFGGVARPRHAEAFMPAAPLGTPSSMLAALVSTNVARRSEPDVVYVHFSGRLVMTPDAKASARMSGPGDAEVVIEGTEGRGITIEDDVNEATVVCSRLEYHSERDIVELVGDDRHPLDLRSPRLTLSGGRFWLQRANGRGGLVGPGRMVFSESSPAVEAVLEHVSFAVDTAVADAGATYSRAVMVAAVRSVGQDEGSQDDVVGPRLEITWQEGIDLDFDDLEDTGHLRQARFRGEVKVASPDFNMLSETLAVDFAENGVREDAIERIVAGGGATVDRIGDAGRLVAEEIDLALKETADGKTVPTVMLASGDVEASDPGQMIWTERLEVHFQEAEADDSDDAEVRRGLAGGINESEVGSVEVTTITADRKVQVRLEEGARVFADQLAGDALSRNLMLAGEDVMVLRENVVADRLREIHFDDAAQAVRGKGPGRFRYFDESVVPESKERIERPTPPDRAAMTATWTESLRYDERRDGKGGELELTGNVRVRTAQSPDEVGRLDSQRLVLDLAEKRKAPGLAAADPAEPGSGDPLGLDATSRELRKLTATGDAVLESRTWTSAARAGEPRLFRVTGDRVEYMVDTREALVDGKGDLLVHDPRPRNQQEEGKKANTLEQGFGIDGTTRFRWAKKMSMDRQVDSRYLIVMQEDVEVLHAGLDPEDTLSLTADRLEVTVERPIEQPAEGGEKPDADEAYQGGVDLGGPTELLRIRGIGHVFVRTPEQDVECEEFDYNVDTEIAMLRARPGRVVTVMAKNAATPIRAELVQWDLRTGRIRILSGEGGIAR
ncbi:MAG: hypothetical protein MK085_04710 [Phycisphaerales bacterium]|nr:hypothetical protein [Phycisphaerales bacterium]